MTRTGDNQNRRYDYFALHTPCAIAELADIELSNPDSKKASTPAIISGYVTAAWVKQRYSISNSTLYAWITGKRLPAPVKLGPRAVRFRVTDILAFEAGLFHSKTGSENAPEAAKIRPQQGPLCSPSANASRDAGECGR